MAVFVFKGVKSDGSEENGEITANSLQDAKIQLRSKKITPISIKRKDTLYNRMKEVQLTTGIGAREMATFTRQFATMINAGLPLMRCLEILHEQEQNPGFKKALKELAGDVEGGTTVAEAMRKHRRFFSDLYVNMVEAGEKGGALDTILLRLAVYLEKSAALLSKIRGAMIYPTMITIVTILAVSAILLFVLPTFKAMFEGLGADLPLPTQIVMMLSDFIRKFFLLIAVVIIGLIVGYKLAVKTPKGLYIKDKLVLLIPVFGPLVRKTSIARFSRTLSTLLSSGVAILDSLEITAKTSGNSLVEQAIYAARTSISEGEDISGPLSREKIFPPMVIQMVRIGEQSGQLDVMLSKVADFYDQEVDQAVENLTAALEPIIMIVLGVVIGGLVVAMYLPIFTMASTFMEHAG
ncbi:type II secretion system F family protein [candidate division WOR-3 bacterium]|nr:type II secretion system F family protein [candidate division WOR-3 bacterium]